jgi:2-keto-4-pentenoate hydratase/2-oxohepta-3-ene-1,7-dioic acid hydratase in catechol pathway
MRIVRFRAGGKIRYAVLEGTHILEYAGTPYGTFKKARKKYLLSQAVLLAPVVPSKIVAVGLNYRDHADEMNVQVPTEPPIFLKPVSALCGPDDPIVFPPQSRRVDYEGELAVVMQTSCNMMTAERAREIMIGNTCLEEMTHSHLHTRRAPHPG